MKSGIPSGFPVRESFLLPQRGELVEVYLLNPEEGNLPGRQRE
jgi:hypothetical protein